MLSNKRIIFLDGLALNLVAAQVSLRMTMLLRFVESVLCCQNNNLLLPLEMEKSFSNDLTLE